MEDACGDKCDGSLYVINYQTLSVITSISGGFYQPHDLAVDDENDVVPNCNVILTDLRLITQARAEEEMALFASLI